MKRKYSILHLINSIEPGGSENLLLNQVRYINMSIFDIHIGYLSGSGRNFNVVSSVKINDFSKQGRFSFLSIFRIWNYARKNRIEIIHTHLIQASLIGRLVAAITPGIKCVTTRHYARTLKSERLINRLEEFGERHSSAVVCISEYVKNYLIRNRFSPAILRVIYNAIDVEHFQCDGASIKKEKIIGTIGRLTEQKGIDILLKAYIFLEMDPQGRH